MHLERHLPAMDIVTWRSEAKGGQVCPCWEVGPDWMGFSLEVAEGARQGTESVSRCPAPSLPRAFAHTSSVGDRVVKMGPSSLSHAHFPPGLRLTQVFMVPALC